MDMLAALATGLAGAFAIERKDVSDTLPGVATAISLMPPLVNVGILLSTGRPDLAWGSLLLFVTSNVIAFRVNEAAAEWLEGSGFRVVAVQTERDGEADLVIIGLPDSCSAARCVPVRGNSERIDAYWSESVFMNVTIAVSSASVSPRSPSSSVFTVSGTSGSGHTSTSLVL